MKSPFSKPSRVPGISGRGRVPGISSGRRVPGIGNGKIPGMGKPDPKLFGNQQLKKIVR